MRLIFLQSVFVSVVATILNIGYAAYFTFFSFFKPVVFSERPGMYKYTKITLSWLNAGMVLLFSVEALPSTIVWYTTLRDLVAPEPYNRPTE